MPEQEQVIDAAKYELLTIKLKEENNHDPKRKDVTRLIGVGPRQAGNYLKKFETEYPVKRW